MDSGESLYNQLMHWHLVNLKLIFLILYLYQFKRLPHKKRRHDFDTIYRKRSWPAACNIYIFPKFLRIGCVDQFDLCLKMAITFTHMEFILSIHNEQHLSGDKRGKIKATYQT